MLTLIGHGMSNKQIARHLGMRLDTVKNHVHNIFHKLKVSNRAMAVALAASMVVLEPVAPKRRYWLVTSALDWLARLLPAVERSRFVAEEQGNLGDCDHWWQRVDHLVGLALSTPRLAWMMRRDGRRGRA